MHDVTSMTREAATTILAIDLGKFKSVTCRFDQASGAHTYETIATTPAAVHDLLIATSPDVLVIEACSASGWISDLAESLSIEVRVGTAAARGPRQSRLRSALSRQPHASQAGGGGAGAKDPRLVLGDSAR